MDAFDGLGRDAVVERVDYAADGAAAVEQRSGASDDFDAIDVHRIQRYGVIIGQRRSVQRADAVAQQANPIAVQATNDRPTGPGAEV